MTDLRILHLAYVTAVNNWAKECEHATADPNNSYSKARERRAWNELKEIEDLIKIEESTEFYKTPSRGGISPAERRQSDGNKLAVSRLHD